MSLRAIFFLGIHFIGCRCFLLLGKSLLCLGDDVVAHRSELKLCNAFRSLVDAGLCVVQDVIQNSFDLFITSELIQNLLLFIRKLDSIVLCSNSIGNCGCILLRDSLLLQRRGDLADILIGNNGSDRVVQSADRSVLSAFRQKTLAQALTLCGQALLVTLGCIDRHLLCQCLQCISAVGTGDILSELRILLLLRSVLYPLLNGAGTETG